MRVGVLGPLQVSHEGLALPVHAAKHRVVLAALLVNANRVVSYDELAEALWDGSPVSGAHATVRTYVSRLRQALGPEVGSRIVTADPGYEFRASADELDLLKFQALGRAGGEAVRRAAWPQAQQLLADALSLWRGRALADVASESLHREHAPGLEQLRLQAIEWRVEADLHLGRGADLAMELEPLAASHPLRERFGAQLMLVLYRAGRQAEALAAYRRVRKVLSEELGVEPGLELQRLHQLILRADPSLDLAEPCYYPPPPASPSPSAGALVPRQLPAVPAHFVGRRSELAELSGLLDQTGPGRRMVVISAIAGMPGVGKTALAVKWAHAVAGRFPDGQLYENLRGYDPSPVPLNPSEILGGFLIALGVPARSLPVGLQARAQEYRNLLAGRRMLVILDNARDEQQVRPLLPESGESVVLITSRTELAGLIATKGARPVRLGVLTGGEAQELLVRRLGPERVAAEPAATAELISLCARLPLALNVAAARGAAHPTALLAPIAADLRQAQLDALDLGDPVTSVRTVFSHSYRNLSPSAARAFRLLGLHPGPDLSLAAAASLLGATGGQARQALSELTRAHLLTEHRPGRFSLHDLIRSYAAERAEQDADPEQRDAAILRMLDHYLHTGATAAFLIRSSRRRITVAACQPGVTQEALADETAALAWLKDEYQVIIGAVALAAGSGFATHAWQIARTITDFLFRRGLVSECAAIQQTAIAACERAGEPAGKADALIALANSHERLGAYDSAHECLRQAFALFDRLGDQLGQGRVHHATARVFERQDRPDRMLASMARARDLFRASRERGEEVRALNGMGWSNALLGDYRQALTYCQQALALHGEHGDRSEQAAIQHSVGYAHHYLGEYEAAVAFYRDALHTFTAVGDRVSEATALTHLGDTYLALGNLDAVAASWRHAMEILDDLGRPDPANLRARLHELETTGGQPA